jgi:hypothetical protein
MIYKNYFCIQTKKPISKEELLGCLEDTISDKIVNVIDLDCLRWNK